MHVLEVYVTRHCLGYPEAVRLVGEVSRLTDVMVRVHVLDEQPPGAMPNIPGTPVYYLDGSLAFLGNPRLEELESKIAADRLK